MDQAIEYINRHGSNHTDAIVTEDFTKARSLSTSSRLKLGYGECILLPLPDGFESGISTDKLHARGPVGLKGLTSQKYSVFGDSHIRV